MVRGVTKTGSFVGPLYTASSQKDSFAASWAHLEYSGEELRLVENLSTNGFTLSSIAVSLDGFDRIWSAHLQPALEKVRA